jgi:hypothetical protein
LDSYLKDLWELHFDKRAEAEETHFKFYQDVRFPLSSHVRFVSADKLNGPDTVEWYLKHGPFDLVLISGCPIIKDPLFGLLPEWKVNAHLGLIPAFKGTMSPFWTHYLLRPNWNGCTFHVFSKYVDVGQIIHQTQALLMPGDGLHDAACRNYVRMCLNIDLVLEHVQGSLMLGKSPVMDPSLARKGKLFTKADWHAGMLQVIYGLYQDRIVDAYLDGYLPRVKDPELVQIVG